MTEIIGINDELQKDTLNYLLIDIDTKKNIYNLVKSENNLITNNNLVLNDSTNKNTQKYIYSIEQYNELETINTLFFASYYFLFIIFLYFIIFKTKYSLFLKLTIGLLCLFYPYIIFTIEAVVYNLFYFLYSYIFSVFSIEKIY
jgi:hypothetical protein